MCVIYNGTKKRVFFNFFLITTNHHKNTENKMNYTCQHTLKTDKIWSPMHEFIVKKRRTRAQIKLEKIPLRIRWVSKKDSYTYMIASTEKRSEKSMQRVLSLQRKNGKNRLKCTNWEENVYNATFDHNTRTINNTKPTIYKRTKKSNKPKQLNLFGITVTIVISLYVRLHGCWCLLLITYVWWRRFLLELETHPACTIYSLHIKPFALGSFCSKNRVTNNHFKGASAQIL